MGTRMAPRSTDGAEIISQSQGRYGEGKGGHSLQATTTLLTERSLEVIRASASSLPVPQIRSKVRDQCERNGNVTFDGPTNLGTKIDNRVRLHTPFRVLKVKHENSRRQTLDLAAFIKTMGRGLNLVETRFNLIQIVQIKKRSPAPPI